MFTALASPLSAKSATTSQNRERTHTAKRENPQPSPPTPRPLPRRAAFIERVDLDLDLDLDLFFITQQGELMHKLSGQSLPVKTLVHGYAPGMLRPR